MRQRRSPTHLYDTPPVKQVRLSYQKLYDEMTPQEAVIWLRDLQLRLARKQERERVYLDSRAARGTHTPTDEAYEEDQRLETELLCLLNELAERLAKEEQP